MKTSMKWIVYAASLGLVSWSCLASGSSTTASTKEPASKIQLGSSQPNGFFEAKNLIGTEVMNTQKKEVGDLDNVVFDPQNGETFAAIGVGHERSALVPWQALEINKTASGKEEITLNTTKQTLESGPSVKNNDWQKLNKRSFAQSVYTYYNLQAPSSAGGVSGSSLGSHSTGYAKSSNPKS